MKYDFTTRYLKDNYNIKSLPQLASGIGVHENTIKRRLKQLGLIKKHVVTINYRHQRSEGMIINIENGIYYGNSREAAQALNYDVRTVQQYVKKIGYYKKLIKVA